MVDKRYRIAEKEETWGGIAEDEVASGGRRRARQPQPVSTVTDQT